MCVVFSLLVVFLGLVLVVCQLVQVFVVGSNDVLFVMLQLSVNMEGGSEIVYQCGDLSVGVIFNGEDVVMLVIGECSFVMIFECVVFGVKYSDGFGNSFWIRGSNDGLLSLKGELDCECYVVEVIEGDGSVGNVVFCVIGNEFGWFVVVDGDMLGLQVEVDYGECCFDVVKFIQGVDGWSGKVFDGIDVKFSFQCIICQDDMSGEIFEVKVMLIVGICQYYGCGNFGVKQL